MKRRIVPNTISKRFRRKLRRCPPEKRFMLWLQCKRPAVYERLTRLWLSRLLHTICNIDPIDTPLVSSAPRMTIKSIKRYWRTDDEIPQADVGYLDHPR